MNSDTVILFDLSGVLVELGGMPDFVEWAGKTSDDIGALWLKSESVRSFERDHMNFDDFHKIFVKEWDVAITNKELFVAFESWVKRVFPSVFDLLSELSDKYILACLTNTNSVQWPIVQKTIDASTYFQYQFASHEIGKVKPDSEAYEHVICTLGTSAENIIFLDDSAINVNAACEIGMNAVQVKGAKEARSSLIKMGVL